MPRKPRVEIEGGLYHVITRGNDRQDIFHTPEDFGKFISLLTGRKEKSPFFLYAWCLMTNHIHLLIERQQDTVGLLMQRVLTGYSQWYNRKYKHVGHVFQGRHKAILCDSDGYLCELVRYIHLNPVRARMVDQPEDYPYSGHREYLGAVALTVTDVDPVLRRMGHTREHAISEYRNYIRAGIGIQYADGVDSPAEVVAPEFIDDTIHRIGTTQHQRRTPKCESFDVESVLGTVASVFGIDPEVVCSSAKDVRAVMAKQLLILTMRDAGMRPTEIADILRVDPSNVTRQYDQARLALVSDSKLSYAKHSSTASRERNEEKSQV